MSVFEPSLANARQASQLAFLESGENIEVGSLADFPLSKAELLAIDKDSEYVDQVFDSGLTAIVYCINVEGKRYNLKKKRDEILVKNDDGQTSFLNEVQRRQDFFTLKQQQPSRFLHIIDTIYASLNDGFILSPWVEGETVKQYKPYIFEQLFFTIVELELEGIFEWDLCPGNIIDDGQQIWIFDFGYMYKHDPHKHFNSNGTDTPLFHGIERFETRNFFDFVVRNQAKMTQAELLQLFRQEKQTALKHYQEKLIRLHSMQVDEAVIAWQTQINDTWQHALESDEALRQLYMKESYRSFLLDALDDIHGKSCSPITLKKLEAAIEYIDAQYETLHALDAFFFGDEQLTRPELLAKFTGLYQDAQTYQLTPNK